MASQDHNCKAPQQPESALRFIALSTEDSSCLRQWAWLHLFCTCAATGPRRAKHNTWIGGHDLDLAVDQ